MAIIDRRQRIKQNFDDMGPKRTKLPILAQRRQRNTGFFGDVISFG
jgi:hypothetical protein